MGGRLPTIGFKWAHLISPFMTDCSLQDIDHFESAQLLRSAQGKLTHTILQESMLKLKQGTSGMGNSPPRAQSSLNRVRTHGDP